ncbi:MAG: CDP-archaeol synthase [Kiritimatiellae bacterium]|nr:CDP-archaeol synthase [Kiritimatiellia bacterium]
MLRERVVSGVVIFALLLAAVVWLPTKGVLPVLLLISALASLEFYHLLDRAGIPSFRIVGVIGGSALITATFFSLLRISASDPTTELSTLLKTYDWEWFVLLGIVMGIFVRQFPQKHNDKPLATIACTLLGVLYVPFLFNFFTKLLFSWGVATGRLLALYLVVVVKSTDIGAFLIGSALGRHKLLPRISPGKTWEGCTGGVACGILASWGFLWLSGGEIGAIPVRTVDAFLLGVLLAVVGIGGDLVESLLKRASNAKDSGTMVPGMGGILDVLDSLLFAAPVLYVYMRIAV